MRLYAAPVPEVSGSFACDPSSVPAARHLVTDALAAWGCADAVWAAEQVVAELAANCALHARTEFTVRLSHDVRGLRLEVEDGSPVRVQLRRYGLESTTGRGMRLVETLSQGWGVDLTRTGKTVWVRLHPGELPADDTVDTADDDLDALLARLGEPGGPGDTYAFLPRAA